MSTIRRGKTTQEGWEETRSVQNEQQAQSVARSLHDIIEGTYFSCRHTAKNLFVYPVLKALGIYEKHIGFVPMAPDATPELKVIGVGYGRTGTVSSFVHPSIHWFIGSLIRSFCRQRLAPPTIVACDSVTVQHVFRVVSIRFRVYPRHTTTGPFWCREEFFVSAYVRVIV